ncbi:MAG: 50S ribosomal protein L3 [Acidobacteria bacterium]|nr:50S ribosomal protein L3 [Acidobacteriota bacterium]
MVNGILGKKLGMTEIFTEDGVMTPITVLQAGPCVVLQRKTKVTDGYEAAQLGLLGDRRVRRASKAQAGHLKKAGVAPVRFQREVELTEGDGDTKAGDAVNVSLFQPMDKVHIIGLSKGRGFAGLVKRHHFRGGAASHGSMFHRAPGSIGASAFPSRVIKGNRAAGRMGNSRVTVRNLQVMKVDTEENLLWVKGSIPGPNGGYLIIKKAGT